MTHSYMHYHYYPVTGQIAHSSMSLVSHVSAYREPRNLPRIAISSAEAALAFCEWENQGWLRELYVGGWYFFLLLHSFKYLYL